MQSAAPKGPVCLGIHRQAACPGHVRLAQSLQTACEAAAHGEGHKGSPVCCAHSQQPPSAATGETTRWILDLLPSEITGRPWFLQPSWDLYPCEEGGVLCCVVEEGGERKTK